jgi:PPOX class probable F420-dependent enzyme
LALNTYHCGVSEHVLPDPGSAFGARVRVRLREESTIWWTTVGRDGTPQPNPVWFLWQDDGFLVYNTASAHRLVHIARRPTVALHFDSDGRGGDIVVFRGRAQRMSDYPAPHDNDDYVHKYGPGMTEISGSLQAFSEAYPIAVRIAIDTVRGY